MAALNDLIAQIADPDLRDRIQQEVNKLNKQKKFGLVWENHEQENALLQGVPVKVGKVVAIKGEAVYDTYLVQSIADGQANCLRHKDQTVVMVPMDRLVCVARVGDAIYPYLEPLDSVYNAQDSDLWHTLIEADNYHALQLLEYLYAGKVDCIYIDPPYNTGARDWKYNNDYVDGNDNYRHSKWLSMIEKRLKLAKKLLNKNHSVLIVTIDEKECHHLGCLLEELFQGEYVQMITSVINPSGKTGMGFSVVEEYIYVVFIGDQIVTGTQNDMLSNSVESTASAENALYWESLLRRGSQWIPAVRPNLFYPIYVNKESLFITRVGYPTLPTDNLPRETADEFIAWPIRTDGSYGIWRLDRNALERKLQNGYAYCGGYDEKRRTCAFKYIMSGDEKRIEDGIIFVHYDDISRHVVSDTEYERKKTPKTVWNVPTHNAGLNGSNTIKAIIGKRFSFPKSLYAVQDTLRFFVANNPNALIIDFFAGSGTTLHAVNLLNAEDGGHRQCIMVTNNEVSNEEAKTLSNRGYHPGDPEWESYGIAKYVTWPRTVCSIKGHDVNGAPLKGNYISSDRPMAEGFKANAAFFKLGFLDKTAVSLGRKFKELLPVMWMQSGAHGPCPTFDGIVPPPYLIFAENRFAILNDENCFAAFAQALEQVPEIETVFLMTESESGYQEMLNALPDKVTHQLYREYTDHFRINVGR